MEQIKKISARQGLCPAADRKLLAAAAAGVWAVRALRAELQKSLDGLNAPGTTQQTTPETEPDWDAQEDTTWQQPVTDVANSKADVPQQTPLGHPLVRSLALVRCANPRHCKAHPRLPAVRRSLPPRLYAGARAQRLQRR